MCRAPGAEEHPLVSLSRKYYPGRIGRGSELSPGEFARLIRSDGSTEGKTIKGWRKADSRISNELSFDGPRMTSIDYLIFKKTNGDTFVMLTARTKEDTGEQHRTFLLYDSKSKRWTELKNPWPALTLKEFLKPTSPVIDKLTPAMDTGIEYHGSETGLRVVLSRWYIESKQGLRIIVERDLKQLFFLRWNGDNFIRQTCPYKWVSPTSYEPICPE